MRELQAGDAEIKIRGNEIHTYISKQSNKEVNNRRLFTGII